MKQTNNAIKFLLAQYRAIYKHALIKGVLSSSVLALGLVTGVAQAEEVAEKSWADLEGVHIVDGETNKLSQNKHQAINVTTDKDALHAFTLKITGSMAADTNKISAKATGSEVKVIIANEATGDGKAAALKIDGASKNASLEVKSIDVQKGSLTITTGTSGDSKATANTIDIGGAGLDSQSKATATVTLSSSANGKTATLGQKAADDTSGSVITVKAGGLIKQEGSSGSTILGDLLKINQNGVLLGSGSGGSIATERIEIDKGGSLIVSGSGTKETLSSQTGTITGNLFVDSGADLIVELAFKNNNNADGNNFVQGTDTAGVLTLASGSHTQLSGSLSLKQGTLFVDDNAKLYSSSATSGTITVSAEQNGDAIKINDNSPTLIINSANLKNFIKGGVSYNKLSYTDGKLTSNQDTSKSGTVIVESGGVLAFKEDSIDLAKLGVKITSGDSNTSGTLSIKDGGYVKANNLTISAKGDNDYSKANIITTNLSLGSSEYDNTSKIEFASAEAKNLEVVSKAGTKFELGSKVTLSSTKIATGSKQLIADVGTISGPLTIATGEDATEEDSEKSLVIDGGNYTASDTILLSGGAIYIKNSKRDTNQDLESNLVIDDLDIDGSQQNDIFVVGSGTSVTIKDFSFTEAQATSQAYGKTKRSEFTAKEGGTINIQGSDLQTVLNTITNSTTHNEGAHSFKILVRKNGRVNIDSAITLNYDMSDLTEYLVSI